LALLELAQLALICVAGRNSNSNSSRDQHSSMGSGASVSATAPSFARDRLLPAASRSPRPWSLALGCGGPRLLWRLKPR